jgi:two-component system, chemotaxis family, chemotaxis protein CheY
MKFLVLEDEFISRNVMVEILSPLGQVETAATGTEAVEKFKEAFEKKSSFDVIFLDIMVPEMTGQEVLRAIRMTEEQAGVFSASGTKVIMTTALGDFANVKAAFKQQCEAYLIKPIDRDKVLSTLDGLGVLKK